MQCACAVFYCHLWPVRLYSIIPHYLINGTIFEKRFTDNKMCVFFFLSTILSERFLITRRTERDTAVSVERSSCKVPVILVRLPWNLNFIDNFSKNTRISNFMKIRPMGAELFHVDGQTNMKLTVAFRNFAIPPYIQFILSSKHVILSDIRFNDFQIPPPPQSTDYLIFTVQTCEHRFNFVST